MFIVGSVLSGLAVGITLTRSSQTVFLIRPEFQVRIFPLSGFVFCREKKASDKAKEMRRFIIEVSFVHKDFKYTL